VLLKNQGHTSEQVGGLLKMNPVTVNNWLTRYPILSSPLRA
jgi:hypothetical protein